MICLVEYNKIISDCNYRRKKKRQNHATVRDFAVSDRSVLCYDVVGTLRRFLMIFLASFSAERLMLLMIV